QHLFEESAPSRAKLDESVTLRSWPGEAREAVEIARAVQSAAARGIPFDRMAVLLRSPNDYREHLEEAFRRAEIPAFFARGTRRPDPAGRALLALLACAGEKLSARRFAEYLSLAQVPDAAERAAAGDARAAARRPRAPPRLRAAARRAARRVAGAGDVGRVARSASRTRRGRAAQSRRGTRHLRRARADGAGRSGRPRRGAARPRPAAPRADGATAAPPLRRRPHHHRGG